MSLNWDMKKVSDVESLHESSSEWAISETIIFATMIVDLGSITEKNIDEWEWRLAFYQAIYGPLMRKDGKPHFLVRENVERRMGLKVNVVDRKRNEWLKKIANLSIKDVILSQKNQEV
jgi:hypothetical protein